MSIIMTESSCTVNGIVPVLSLRQGIYLQATIKSPKYRCYNLAMSPSLKTSVSSWSPFMGRPADSIPIRGEETSLAVEAGMRIGNTKTCLHPWEGCRNVYSHSTGYLGFVCGELLMRPQI